MLGAVELLTGSDPIPLGPPRQCVVLAALAVDASRVVSVDLLVDRVWGEDSPPRVRRTLHSYITRLRALLRSGAAEDRPAAIVRKTGGYLLDIDADHVDVHHFRALLARSSDPDCGDGRRLQLLRTALGLWHGPPLAGLPGEWAERTRQLWAQQRVDAVVAWAEAEIRAGNPQAVPGPVGELAEAHSMAESLVAVQMRALATAGRPSEALTCYASARRRLADELGVDPGPQLQGVYQAILSGDLDLPATRYGGPANRAEDRSGDLTAQVATTRARTPTGPREPTVPRQLPPRVRHFAGRAAELRHLTALAEAATQPGASVVIATISGTAGVGKTALAVRWAHQNTDRFPDGQMYVNLRGFDAGGRVMTPEEALQGFLNALGVPARRTPPELDARSALYRSLIAGRRMLVLLDNARDARQVRPLLPAASAMVVVTSRNQLTPLVATDGAHPLSLDLFTAAESVRLLALRLSAERVAAEPEAVHQIVNACARLPLALSIAAARALQSRFSLAALACEMDSTSHRLDSLDAGDTSTQIRAVLSWSYTTLTRSAARLFRLLGLHPGPDISMAAAASLVGLPVPEARRLLTELTRSHLLTEHAPGRYCLHDLLRIYAAELTQAYDPDNQRRAATIRLLDHYTHTAFRSERLLSPNRDPIAVPLTAPAPGADPESPADRGRAMTWFQTEHAVLLATLQHAADARLDSHAWQLAWSSHTYLDWQGHWRDLAAAWQNALSAAGRLGDPVAQAIAHRLLAHAATMLGHYLDAHAHYDQALHLYTRTGNRVGRAQTHRHLGNLLELQGQIEDALCHSRQALKLLRSTTDRRGLANALNSLGWQHFLAGQYDQALTDSAEALTLFQQIDDQEGQANTWDTIGCVHQHAGRHDRANECYQQSVTLCRKVGNRFNEATVLTHLGALRQVLGNPDAARTAWDSALRILAELDHPDAAQVRAKLAMLDQGRAART
ncbi:MAG TPA: BTAD domain-containing putative transcriptional regulator [Rugosimonospora sp.]|nr:BTAD domain-containing putative transcriptional regulator [Rugosimonospora sp.]